MNNRTFRTLYFNNYKIASEFAVELAQLAGERSIKLIRHNGGFNVYTPKEAESTVKKLFVKMGQKIADNPIITGVFGVGIFNLLAINSSNKINPLVIEAFQRSSNDLTNANQKQIAEYIQAMEPEQLQGMVNNVKGIYHELAYIANENSDGDEWTANVFETTNHAGSDVILTNNLTGEVQELQLKATDSSSYAMKHSDAYPDTNIQVTSEVAASTGIESSGFENDELINDVHDTAESIGADIATDSLLEDTLLDLLIPGAAMASVVSLADSTNKNKSTLQRNTTVKKASAKSGLVSLGLGLMFGIF